MQMIYMHSSIFTEEEPILTDVYVYVREYQYAMSYFCWQGELETVSEPNEESLSSLFRSESLSICRQGFILFLFYNLVAEKNGIESYPLRINENVFYWQVICQSLLTQLHNVNDMLLVQLRE